MILTSALAQIMIAEKVGSSWDTASGRLKKISEQAASGQRMSCLASVFSLAMDNLKKGFVHQE